jgi:hypothetical protein
VVLDGVVLRRYDRRSDEADGMDETVAAVVADFEVAAGLEYSEL